MHEASVFFKVEFIWVDEFVLENIVHHGEVPILAGDMETGISTFGLPKRLYLPVDD